MGIIHKRRRAAAGCRRSSPKKTGSARRMAGQFMRNAFYYLKAEQFLKTSMRFLCEAV